MRVGTVLAGSICTHTHHDAELSVEYLGYPPTFPLRGVVRYDRDSDAAAVRHPG